MTSKAIHKGTPIIAIMVLLFVSVLITQTQILLDNKAVAFAVTFDLLIGIPVIYYLLIKNTSIHKTTVIPLVILGVLVGTYFLPKESQGYLDFFKSFILPIFEITIVSLLIVKVRAAVKLYRKESNFNADFFTTLKKTCYEIYPKVVLYPSATQIAFIYYGFFKWHSYHLADNEFSYHRKSGTTVFLYSFLFIIAIETFVVHLLISQWSNLIAWILTGLSIYTLLQIFGFAKSLAFRPVIVVNEYLNLRYGIFSEVQIPLSEIEQIILSKKEIEPGFLTKALSPFYRIERHNVVLGLKSEQTIIGLYGTKKVFKKIAFCLDEPEKFKEELNNALQQKL